MRRQILFLADFMLLFLVSGFLHVLLYGAAYADSIMLIIYGAITLLWGISIAQRIVDGRLRRLMLAISSQIELFFLLQICNFKLFTCNVDAKRYCWYGYYIPMNLIPLLLLFLALYTNRPEEKKVSKKWSLAIVWVSLIVLGFVTNDLHFLAFRFLEPVMSPTASRSLGPVYYLYVATVVILSVTAFCIFVRKCRVTISRKESWIPMVPLLLGAIWLLANVFGTPLKIRGITLWNMGEVFFFMTLGFLENCIRVGLIPANTEYETIFGGMKLPVRIADADGQIRFSSGGEDAKFEQSDRIHLENKVIGGGSVTWAVDVTELIELDKQIREATEQIELRNEYLRSENDLKAEAAAISARNNLYDTIAATVKPQLDRIRTLLSAEDEDFTERLKKISVLNVYIKRRSNMELLLSDSPELSITELTLALREALSYLELCGTQTMLISGDTNVDRVSDRKLPAGMLTLAFDCYEAVIEAAKDPIKAISVSVSCRGQGEEKPSDTAADMLTLRLMLTGSFPEQLMKDWEKEALQRYHGSIDVEAEEEDTVVTLRLGKGGDVEC